MPFFPKQAQDCTRHPIRVKLQQIQDPRKSRITIAHETLGPRPINVSKGQVCDEVQKVMDKSKINILGESQVIIGESEVIIEIDQVSKRLGLLAL